MPRKSIVVVDVIWEFRMSKQIQISTEAARGNIIPTDVSKKQNRFNHSHKKRIVWKHGPS